MHHVCDYILYLLSGQVYVIPCALRAQFEKPSISRDETLCLRPLISIVFARKSLHSPAASNRVGNSITMKLSRHYARKSSRDRACCICTRRSRINRTPSIYEIAKDPSNLPIFLTFASLLLYVMSTLHKYIYEKIVITIRILLTSNFLRVKIDRVLMLFHRFM